MGMAHFFSPYFLPVLIGALNGRLNSSVEKQSPRAYQHLICNNMDNLLLHWSIKKSLYLAESHREK
jgi:hypothetical protein